MDLIREWLLRLEEAGEENPSLEPLEEIGYSRERIGHHAFLLVDAGLATGYDAGTDGEPLPRFGLISLTWEGHEFLDAARDEGRWLKAKSILSSAGGFSVVVMREVLVGLVRNAVQTQF